jgi:hypothetical protein
VFEAAVGDAERGEPALRRVGVAVAVVFEGSWRGVELAAVAPSGRAELYAGRGTG